MSMKYINMELGPIMTNCYIVYDTDTKDAMVVDPAWDYPAIDKALTSHGLTLRFIFLTHGHADHIGALQELRQRKNVPVYVAPVMPTSFPIRTTTCPCSWARPSNVRRPTTWSRTAMN